MAGAGSSLSRDGLLTRMKRPKVLLVDDEPSVLRSTALLLSELGYDTATTSEPERVVDTLRAERPDVLLQDVRMPGLDLDELVRRVRADPDVGGTPVLLFSASMDLPEVSARVGANGYLEKPFRPDEVVRAIEEVLRGVAKAGAGAA